MVDYLNSEHYPDPTAQAALSRIEKKTYGYRPIIYVCSPYAGDVLKNTKKARDYCRYVLKKGGLPLAPHLLFPQFMEDRELALYLDTILVRHSVELWAFGGKITEGMKTEMDYAKKKSKPIRIIKEEWVYGI